jgi:S-(hydroxymethyl)glutathione dehydrogenase/alcohol dehydrogenase
MGVSQQSQTIQVRAALFDEPGAPLRVEEISLECPGPNDVLVRMFVVGICGSDLHVIRGEWDRPVPMVLGHEGSGAVEAVGEDVVGLAVGDRVVISWAPGCQQCAVCADGRPAACPKLRAGFGAGTLPDGTTRLSQGGNTIYRMTAVGALSTHVVMPRAGVIKMPDSVSYAEGALLGCAAITGAGAVVNLIPDATGASSVVIGAGGVGQFVIQALRSAGASRIIAVDPQSARRDQALELGATHAVVPDDLPALLEGLGDVIDYSFEAVGSQPAFELAVASVRNGGTTVVVGIPPAGTTVAFDPADLVVREKTVVGSMYGSGEPAETLRKLLGGQTRLDLASMIGPEFLLDEVNEAFDLARQSIAKRILVLPNGREEAGPLAEAGR